MSRQLILSSSSPARRLLLQRLMLPFTTTSPDLDETPLPGENAEQLVRRLAKLKAWASSEIYPEALIIGADQVGTLDSEILCKPLTHQKAVEQLLAVSGKTIRFYTGMCLLDAKYGGQEIAVTTYDVTFRHLTQDMIEGYLEKEEALNCAGSFQVEGLGIALIEKLEGDDYTSLIGLPLITLVKMLEKRDMSILG